MERTIYRITYKMLLSIAGYGSWSDEDLPYPSDGGPNGWVLSGLEVVAHPNGGVILVAHWCRVDPCGVEEMVQP